MSRDPHDWLHMLLVLGLGAVTLALWVHGTDVEARLEKLEAQVSAMAASRTPDP